MSTKSKYYISPINKRDKDMFEHSTIKPYNFVKNHIINSTNEGDIVLDTFCGSGTVPAFAKNLTEILWLLRLTRNGAKSQMTV